MYSTPDVKNEEVAYFDDECVECDPCEPDADDLGDSCDDILPFTLPVPDIICQLSKWKMPTI